MIRSLVFAAAVLFAGSAFAAEEMQASSEEAAKVTEALGKVGCKAPEIEKERSGLFEIDDATCDIGQYDIKLDADYNITVMTRD